MFRSPYRSLRRRRPRPPHRLWFRKRRSAPPTPAGFVAGNGRSTVPPLMPKAAATSPPPFTIMRRFRKLPKDVWHTDVEQRLNYDKADRK